MTKDRLTGKVIQMLCLHDHGPSYWVKTRRGRVHRFMASPVAWAGTDSCRKGRAWRVRSWEKGRATYKGFSMAPPYASPQALEVKFAFSYGCKRGLFLTGLCPLGQVSKESSEASVYTCSPPAPSAQSDPAVVFSTFVAVKGPNSISSLYSTNTRHPECFLCRKMASLHS